MHKNIFKIFLKNFEIVEKGGFSEVKSLLKQKPLSRQSLLTHDRKRSLAYNEDEQYKSVVFNRAFPS